MGPIWVAESATLAPAQCITVGFFVLNEAIAVVFNFWKLDLAPASNVAAYTGLMSFILSINGFITFSLVDSRTNE